MRPNMRENDFYRGYHIRVDHLVIDWHKLKCNIWLWVRPHKSVTRGHVLDHIKLQRFACSIISKCCSLMWFNSRPSVSPKCSRTKNQLLHSNVSLLWYPLYTWKIFKMICTVLFTSSAKCSDFVARSNRSQLIWTFHSMFAHMKVQHFHILLFLRCWTLMCVNLKWIVH